MKLGITYNLFDGYELLEYVLENSSKYTDFCCVVVQDTSNLGHRSHKVNLEAALNKSKHLIDEIIRYEPNLSLSPYENEIKKRNLGLECCRNNGCSHGISADIDEFYDPAQVHAVKELIIEKDYLVTACKMLEYYKDTHHIFPVSEYYFVSFIFKLLSDTELVLNTAWPINVDPTRRVPCNEVAIFNRNFLQLHHLTLVRSDITDKYMNSSNQKNVTADNIKQVKEYYDTWDESKPALVMGNPPNKLPLYKVNYNFLPEIKFDK